MLNKGKLDDALHCVAIEVEHAMNHHPAMNTCHEGYAVILEELDELWDQIKVKQSKRDTSQIRDEAIRVAAMAVRFIHDLDGTK